jgi:uncharacterized NAD(P)/FAD-binding protein YdhS
VLAVGHEERPANARGVAIRVGSLQDTPIPSASPVMILGSGLSMVDAWLMLAARQHTGPILVVSRHGLLPMAHRRAEPISIDAADVPFGTSLPYFTRWFRKLVGDVVGAGCDWRSVVDGLRPFNQRIWQNWTPHSRQQFLRHLRPWWNIHRHRLPQQMHARLQEAVARGKVQLLAAEFLGTGVVQAEGIVDPHASARIRARGKRGSKDVAVARVCDCGGVSVGVDASSNPLIQSLVGNGQARPDPLHISLDVTPDCALIDASGRPSRRVLVVGPLTRGAFFEIEAIPDIRLQCAALATRILNGHLRSNWRELLPQWPLHRRRQDPRGCPRHGGVGGKGSNFQRG